jgi:hypothetical protein
LELQDEPFISWMKHKSEDDVQDVADWIVSQGQEFYASVLADPTLTPSEVDVNDPTNLAGVAENVFLERFGEVLYWY